MKPYILGIDGGGTKTAACAIDMEGAELFRLRGGALNLNGESAGAVQATLKELLIRAEELAGGELAPAAVGIGAAGYSNPETAGALRDAAGQAGFGGPLLITGDHVIALAGALGREPGILVIAGTGSVCAGQDAEGNTVRVGGRGHLLDDEGGGYAIGRDMLRAVVRAEDGRSPRTCLTEMVYERLQLHSVEELVGYVYRPGLPKSGIAVLAELLEEGCRRGDRTALAIRRRAAQELVGLASTAAGRLGLTSGRLAVAGSVLLKNDGLRREFGLRAAKRLPGFAVTLPARDAAYGAALLAAEKAIGRNPENRKGKSAEEFDWRMAAQSGGAENCLWHPVPGGQIAVRGLGFFETEKRWNRLPAALKPYFKKERPAMELVSGHMAGAQLCFCTDSGSVWVRAELDRAPYMSHMTPAAQCGFDCYLRFSEKEPWRFAGVSKFPVDQSRICCRLAEHLSGRRVEVCINLPLYTGVRSIEIGLEEGALAAPPPDPACPVTLAFYGTSITQGGCAGHSGMAYPAIIGRALDAQVYNMGFSGNGVGLPGLAPALCSLPGLGVLAVDMEANAGEAGVLGTNLPLFLDEVRRCAPALPVLVLAGTLRTEQSWNAGLDEQRRMWTRIQKNEVERRFAAGDSHIFFADASELLGEAGWEATQDGVHLNDLGFWLLARGLLPVLRRILPQE